MSNEKFIDGRGKGRGQWQVHPKAVISVKQEKVIYGTLLGDSGLERPKSSGDNPRMKTTHREEDKEYLEWIWRQLPSELFPNPPKQRVALRTWSVRSITNPIFMDLRNIFYPDGVKEVNLDILDKLGDLGVAIWYMDDGSFGKYRQFRLYTDSFTYKENQLISSWFLENYGLHMHIHKRDSANNYYLTASTDGEVESLLLKIEPYISQVKCMKRKSWYNDRASL